MNKYQSRSSVCGLLSALLVGTVGCASYPAAAQNLKFDFGVAAAGEKSASPLEKGFVAVTRQTTFDEARGYGWLKPPESAFDIPLTYPPSDLHRDGVGISPEGATFAVKLPRGDYNVSAHMGTTSVTEYRPGMFVKVNGEYKVRGLMAGGNAHVATFPVKVRGDRLELEFGSEVFGLKRATALLGLEFVPQKAVAPAPTSSPGFSVRPALRWLSKEKIRGLYSSPVITLYDTRTQRYRTANSDYQRDIVRNGMNALVSNFSGREENLDEWVKFSKKQRGRFHLFGLCNVGSGPEWDEIQGNVRKVVYADGRVDNKPHPFEWEVWQKIVIEPSIAQIRRARSAGGRLEGMLIDTEMYGAKIAEVYNNNASFDAQTLNEYAREKGLVQNLEEGAAGFRALSEKNLIPDYLKWQEDKVAAIAARAAAIVRKEDPNFLFGFLQWKENFWYLRALVRGLGIPGVPTLVLGEDTYYGYNNDAARQREVFRAMGANAMYIPGLWPNQFSPRGLRTAATQTLYDADGYWLYGVPVFYSTQKTGETPAPGRALPHDYFARPATEYWAAIKDANADATKKGKPARTNWDSEPAQIGPRDWVVEVKQPPIPDRHQTDLVKIVPPARPLHLFDMGIAASPVKEGFTPIFYNTLYSVKTGYGWLNRVSGSFDREQAEPLDDLTRDGLMISIDNTFRIDVPNGNYEVSVVLGDMSPNEERPWQNVRINGQHVLRDVLTNGGEYRVWSFPVTVKDGKIDILFEAVGPQRDSVLAVMIGRQ